MTMFVFKHNLMEKEPGGGGGGGDLAAQVATLTTQLATQNTELERLRTHSTTLLDEKKKLQKQFTAFENLGDPERIANMLKQFDNDEDAKAFAEGKGNEVLARHTERLTLEHNQAMELLQTKYDDATAGSTKFAQLYHESEAGHAVRTAATSAGVLGTAVSDILLRSKGIFTVTDNGDLEARDKDGNLRLVGGKALTPGLFIEGLRDKSPHYWPDSQGSGGHGAGGSTQVNPFIKGKDYNLTEQAKVRRQDPELAKRLEGEAKAA